MAKKASGVDNTFRRKWDREEYAERARERDKELEEDGARPSAPRGPPVQRKPLQHRDYEVDLESRLGKTQIVTQVAPLSQQAGYYCNVCECVVKDSANYLDHINGKKHQRALGMSMRVKRSTLSEVQERFELLKRKADEQPLTEEEFDSRLLAQQEAEEQQKRQKKEARKEKKKAQTAPSAAGDEEMDPELAALMGFGGFGSTKR